MSRKTGNLLLIGGGRTHLTVLEAVARKRIAAAAVTLVSPHPRQLYSGMVPGYIAGRYSIDELTIDLPALLQGIGGQFRQGVVQRLDAVAHTVTLDDGTLLPWDVASVAIVGLAVDARIPGVRDHARLVKPVARLLELRAALDAAAQAAGPEPLQIVVVGAGATGVEVALAVRARLDELGANRAIISLVDSTHTPLRDHGPAARNAAEAALRRAEITLRLSTAVEEVGADYARLTGGRVVPVDLVIWSVGMEVPPLYRASALPTDAHGFLVVEDSLAVPDCPGLFGAGAAVSLQSNPRASKSGVSPVRQGRVLVNNLGRALSGLDHRTGAPATGAYSSYTPGPRTLDLLNLSDGSAILSQGAFVITAEWAMKLKDRIDHRFVHRFRRLYS